jgi:hypothetical protein
MGNWRITEVKLRSGQTIYPAYDFKNEKFNFKEDNLQGLITPGNKTYEGKWYISSNTVQQDCYTAPAGNTVCSDVKQVDLDALTWIPTTQETKTIYFRELEFFSGNSFKATIIVNPVTAYDYYFKRE